MLMLCSEDMVLCQWQIKALHSTLFPFHPPHLELLLILSDLHKHHKDGTSLAQSMLSLDTLQDMQTTMHAQVVHDMTVISR